MSHYTDLVSKNNPISESDLASENKPISENDLASENNPVSENEALRSHLEAYISQLFGKEEIHSMDKKTIMGTDYARLSLKTQSL